MNRSIDFVIPLHKNNIIFRSTIESIVENYNPKNIYIITNTISITELLEHYKKWNICSTNLFFIDESIFFLRKFNMHKDDIEKMYFFIDEKSREFGWWYQQIIKLGAFQMIENLSDPYIVWDSDLIVLDKWELYPTETVPFFQFAILQEAAKNQWNRDEYYKSIKYLLGLDAAEPDEGTFVPHHFIFYHAILSSFFLEVEKKYKMVWFECIMRLSKLYYRFSEYKCIATYMKEVFPEYLHYHSFNKYGKRGIRYRDCEKILSELYRLCIINKYGLSYSEMKKFTNNYYLIEPSYLQLEHII